MNAPEKVKVFTVEEYILMEEAGEVRHEFINGNLIEMSGASREHHKLCKKLMRFFEDLLSAKGFEVYMKT